ncbi:hypothetical protein [Cryobacterium sp. TMT4-10]|uniref:hypothetical protein n=1 Tax=Cryobacterium sp. TMT4-10 TaxID=1259256 RepID=UPI00106D6672|nr:hypothetical protein [Cryobacterium sp. TMT4-10]TFD13139.1 hypothetical protein E3T42_14305 [Cryobacterium sp. TMT4-10]
MAKNKPPVQLTVTKCERAAVNVRARKPKLVTVAFTVLVLPLLAGCSNPGATTCDEYAAMDNASRQSTERALLKAHNLDTGTIGNSLGVTAALDSYCGVSDNVIAGLPSSKAATQNNDSAIDNATDWTATNW